MSTIPKRSEERRRRNKVDVDRAPAVTLPAWPAPDPEWHSMARDWFVSLGVSGQAVYYQPSDMEMARIGAAVLSKMLSAPRISSQLLASWLALSTTLLATEGDRRRLRLELQRQGGVDEDEEASVTAFDRYRGSRGA